MSAMNCKRGLIGVFPLAIPGQLMGFGQADASLALARLVSAHSVRMCRALLVPLLHSQGVGGFMGFESAAVRPHFSHAVAQAIFRVVFPVGAKGRPRLLLSKGGSSGWNVAFHSVVMVLAGAFLRHVSVVLNHEQSSSADVPWSAHVSAILLPAMPSCDGTTSPGPCTRYGAASSSPPGIAHVFSLVCLPPS